MIKAFISYSHKDKEYADELVNALGRESCIIDMFDFSPAYPVVDEIFKAIDKATVFVLLISRFSLESNWVKDEVHQALKKLPPEETSRFFPYIIEEGLSVNDFPQWMTEILSINIRFFRSPLMLEKDLQEKIRRIRWKRNPALAKRELTFIGRNAEIDTFQSKLYSSRGRLLRAHITSGRPGIGKDCFAMKCLSELDKTKEFEPYRISMEAKDTIEFFILQLNQITRLYSDEEMRSGLAGPISGKVGLAVSMLNDIYSTNDVVFIEDRMSCIQPNLKPAQWLIDIIESPELKPHLGLFIQSSLSPHAYLEADHPKISHIVLHPLSNADRAKLLYLYLQSYDVVIEPEDVRFFVDKLLCSPNQLLMAVDTIKNYGLKRAKNEIQNLIEIGDRRVRPIFSLFNEGERRNFILMLAKFEFLSFDLLEKIYGTQYDSILDIVSDGLVYGILEVFGPNDEYVKLDNYLSDYVRRNRLEPDKDLSMCVADVLEDELANSKSATDDVSLYLYNIKNQILSGRTNSDTYLFPSVVIKSIMDLYERRKWNDVIRICDKVLNDCNNYYPDVRREVLYWQCSAFCRPPQNPHRFFSLIDQIDGNDNTFLRGFFYRNAKNYPKAEELYRSVLKKDPQMRRAKRELVSVLLAQRKYPEALEMAAENYSRDRENSYHIYAYFRCLIKKEVLNHEDVTILDQLIEDVKCNYSSKKEELLSAMRLEYNIIVKKISPSEALEQIKSALRDFPDSVNVSRVVDEFKFKQGFISVLGAREEDELLF